jgi:DNA topoisomerase-1
LKQGNLSFAELTQMTGAEKQKLFPTDMGIIVTDFLLQHFPEIMDYSFTANVEEEFDIVAEGKLKRTKMIQQFYQPFHHLIVETGGLDRVHTERTIGTDPKS